MMDIQLELSKNVFKSMKTKQVHLLVEIGLIASAGGLHNGVQKGGGLHSGEVQPEFGQLRIADNKRR